MPIAAPIVGAIIGGAATVISSVMQSSALEDQAAAQREATASQQRAADVQSQKERIKQIREARIRRSQIMASGINMGAGVGTSGIGGAVGSVASQMSENIGTINQMQDFAQDTSRALQKATDAGVEAAGWQMIGNFSKSIFDQSGGFTTIFGGNTFTKAGS